MFITIFLAHVQNKNKQLIEQLADSLTMHSLSVIIRTGGHSFYMKLQGCMGVPYTVIFKGYSLAVRIHCNDSHLQSTNHNSI